MTITNQNTNPDFTSSFYCTPEDVKHLCNNHGKITGMHRYAQATICTAYDLILYITSSSSAYELCKELSPPCIFFFFS